MTVEMYNRDTHDLVNKFENVQKIEQITDRQIELATPDHPHILINNTFLYNIKITM